MTGNLEKILVFGLTKQGLNLWSSPTTLDTEDDEYWDSQCVGSNTTTVKHSRGG